MAQQTINIGANPNDNTGDPLRVAGVKINANFTEVYTTSQAGFNQANTGTTLAQVAFNFANTIVSDTQIDPYARATANAGFDQANTATDTAQAGFDQANTATDTAQAGFDQANTANTLAQAAFDQANTAGGASLPLANGISNIDIALENGPITLTANVFIMTIDDTNGSIDLPGNVTNFEACSAINFVPNSSGDGLGYSTIQLVPDTNATQDQYIIIDPTAPGHIHVRAGGQQDGSSADLFLGGEYSNFKVPAGSNTPVYITANNNVWQFDDAGVFKVPGAVNFQQNATIPLGAPVANGVNDRVTLWDFEGGGSGFNYAIGAEGNHIWFTMDVNNGTGGFKFYSRDNEVFKIRDDGTLIFLDGTTNSGNTVIASDVYNIQSISNTVIQTSANAGAKTWDFGTDGSLTFPDSTIQTTAAAIPGFRNVIVVNTSTHNTANNEEILLCDPNAAGSNVDVNFSSNVSDGKIFTVKNINPGGNNVIISASTIEDPVSKSIVSQVVMANTGEVYTWVAYSGVYRHIG